MAWEFIDMQVKPVDKKAASIALMFGIISIILLILLKAQGVFLIILIWMLVPVLIKQFRDRFFKNEGKP
ncbi:MAG: hypothetical protein R6U61_05215 [Thermoplasmata archaeon]